MALLTKGAEGRPIMRIIFWIIGGLIALAAVAAVVALSYDIMQPTTPAALKAVIAALATALSAVIIVELVAKWRNRARR
jgi:hypothetical protein